MEIYTQLIFKDMLTQKRKLLLENFLYINESTINDWINNHNALIGKYMVSNVISYYFCKENYLQQKYYLFYLIGIGLSINIDLLLDKLESLSLFETDTMTNLYFFLKENNYNLTKKQLNRFSVLGVDILVNLVDDNFYIL